MISGGLADLPGHHDHRDVEPAGIQQPQGLTRVVYSTRDEGIHFAKDATPVRRVRSHKRETLQWRYEQTGASLKVSYPSEEVTLLPVGGQ